MVKIIARDKINAEINVDPLENHRRYACLQTHPFSVFPNKHPYKIHISNVTISNFISYFSSPKVPEHHKRNWFTIPRDK